MSNSPGVYLSLSVCTAEQVAPNRLDAPPASLRSRHPRGRHPGPVGPWNVDHGVFPAATALDGDPKSTALVSAHGVGSPSEPDRLQVTAHLLQLRGDSLEVCCPSSTQSSAGPPTPGLPHPAAAPPSGFLTLSTTCSLRHPAALFRAAGAHGVSPFRASPCERSRGASRHPQPSCRQPPQLALPWHRLQGLAPRRSTSPVPAVLPACGAVALLGLRPLQGIATAEPGRTPRGVLLLPWASSTPSLRGPRTDHTSPVRRPSGVLLDSRPDAAALTTTSALMRFSTSSLLSQVWRMAHPGSLFRLRSRATSPRPADRLRVGPRLLPESPES